MRQRALPREDVGRGALGPVDRLPPQRAGRDGVGPPVHDHAGRVVVVLVPHPGRGGAVVPEAHDPRDGVHAEVGGLVGAAVVEHLLALGHRAAVGAHDRPDGAHRAAAVHQERTLPARERERGPAAVVGRELGLVAVQHVHAAGAGGGDRRARLAPAVRERAAVVRRGDRGGLGVQARRERVRRRVGAGRQLEAVVHVRLAGSRAEAAARAEEVDVGAGVRDRVGDRELLAQAGDDARR